MDELRKTFHHELDAIRDEVVRLGASVIEAIPRATAVLLTGDLEGADYLVKADDEIDSRSIEIEDKCLLVKKYIGHKETVYEFNTQWAKIEPPLKGSKTFNISQSQLRVELGQFIRHEQQIALIAQVRAHLG